MKKFFKKMKKTIKFLIISALMFLLFAFIGRHIFMWIWDFDITTQKSYLMIVDYWNEGGVFDTPKDCLLGLSLILYPVLWLYCSIKLFKFGLFKFIFWPIAKTYRYFSKPKNVDPVHVNIKNLGSKDLSLDEIISSKLKEKGIKKSSGNIPQNLRQQISRKIEENNKG